MLVSKLLVIINEQINTYKQQIDEYDSNDENLKLQSDIDKIINDPSQIVNFNINKIVKFLDNEMIIKKLLFLQTMYKSKIDVNSEQQEYIKNIINDIYNKIELNVKNNDNAKNDLIINIDKLSNIKSKIENIEKEGFITGDDLKYLNEFIKNNPNLNTNEKIEIIIYLTNKSIENTKGKLLEKEDIEVLEESNISKNDVETLFSKYGYNFSDLNSKSQNRILKYGKLNNMEDIFIVFQNYRIINLNLKEYSNQFASILTLSNKNIVSKILEKINEEFDELTNSNNKGEVTEKSQILNAYLMHPSIFIRGIKKLEKRFDNEDTHSITKDDEISGCHDNYIKNIEILKSLGINNISQVLWITSHNPKSLENRIKSLDFYKIPREKYQKTLSVLSTDNALSAIDMFIELDCYDYIIQNLSRVKEPIDSLMFYKIKKARLAKVDKSQIFLQYKSNETKLALRGDIIYDSQSFLEVDKNNYKDVTSRFIPPIANRGYYEGIVNQSQANGPLEKSLEDEFIKELDMYKQDDLRYVFDGVIISRYKVLRYYEELLKRHIISSYDALMFAICKNSLLTYEEYEKIEKEISNIFDKKKRVDIK